MNEQPQKLIMIPAKHINIITPAKHKVHDMCHSGCRSGKALKLYYKRPRHWKLVWNRHVYIDTRLGFCNIVSRSFT
jgi:hypothetical protein